MIKTKEDTKDAIITGKVPPQMRGRYTIRIKEATAKNSKSAASNFMIELVPEIVDPLTKTFVDGKTYALDSLNLRMYLMLKIFDEDGTVNLKKTAAALDNVLDLHSKLGLPVEIDDENPNVKQYVGLLADAIISSSEKIPQEVDPNTGKYKVITDAHGKPVSQGWEIKPSNIEILGLSKTVVKPAGVF